MPSLREANLRHVRYYLSVMRRANELYLQGGQSILQALAIFDQEWAQIQSGQAWVTNQDPSDDEMATLSSTYVEGDISLLDLRQDVLERIRWLESSLNAARQLNRRETESSCLGNLGGAYLQIGQYERAIDCCYQALAISREIGDKQKEGNWLANLGDAYNKLGMEEKAVRNYQQALAISQEIKGQIDEANYLIKLGETYSNMMRYEEAVKHYNLALSITKNAGDMRKEGTTLRNLGNAYAKQGDIETAIDYYTRALAIVKEIGDRREEANHLDSLGTVYRMMRDYQKAVDHYEQALAISSITNAIEIQQRNYLNLGITYADGLCEYPRAYSYLLKAIDLIERMRENFTEEKFRQNYFHNRLYTYDLMINVCLRIQYRINAWNFVERCRSREFLTELGYTTLTLSEVIGSELFSQEKAIIEDIRDFEAKLSQIDDDAIRSRMAQLIRATRDKLDLLLVEAKDVAPEYVALRRGEPASWEEIRRCMSPR